MSKYIVVVDLDDDIIEDYDELTIDYDVRGLNISDDFIESIKYIEGAKLKPMPRKKEIEWSDSFWKNPTFKKGFNACIDEITGEEE